MKSRPSKLDRYAEQLAELEAEGLTLADMQKWLKAENISVSPSRLSVFLESQRTARLHERLLGQIATGSRAHQEIEKQFSKNAAPELETLIKLHRVLIMQLSTQAAADPALLEMVSNAMKPVMDFAKLNLKRDELTLAKDKFEFDATREAMKKLDTLKAIKADSKLTEEEKLQQARLELFGVTPT